MNNERPLLPPVTEDDLTPMVAHQIEERRRQRQHEDKVSLEQRRKNCQDALREWEAKYG